MLRLSLTLLRWRKAWVICLSAVFLFCLLYVSQLSEIWHAQEAEASENAKSSTTSVMIGWRQPRFSRMTGAGVATNAKGVIRYNGNDPIAVMTIDELPVLPPTSAYQLWCYDQLGSVDPATVFDVTIDSSPTKIVMVTAPRLFDYYVNFSVTIEPAAGSRLPTGAVVLHN